MAKHTSSSNKGRSNQTTLFCNIGNQSKPSILQNSPEGLEYRFLKKCRISFEMFLMLPRVTPSSNINDFMNFLFRPPLATLWKYFKLQSPSFYLTLIFRLQWTSSFNNNSSNSPFLKTLNIESSGVKFPSCSPISILTMYERMFHFLF